MSYKVRRTAMHIGMKTIGDQFLVEWETTHEEASVASFWIGEHMLEAEAKARADSLAAELNAKGGKRLARAAAHAEVHVVCGGARVRDQIVAALNRANVVLRAPKGGKSR